MAEYFTSLFDDIKNSVAKNVKPGIVLQLFAVSFVLSYYFVPSARPFFDTVMKVKSTYGIFYSIAATCFFGGVIPLFVLKIMGRFNYPDAGKRGATMLLFWAWKGIEVFLFYGFQAWLFGADPTVSTVAKKVSLDQFVFNPVWAAPSMLLVYMFVDSGCSSRNLTKKLNISFFTHKMPTALCSTWVVWIPATTILYSLPVDLQIPVCNLILCFWSLVFELVSKGGIKR